MLSKTILVTALALAQGIVAIPAEVEPRAATCNRDNLLRCFVDKRYHVSASAYCSALEPSTTTVATATVTATVTASPDLEAVGDRRAAGEAPLPRCASDYAPERLTSACACIDVPAKTVSATATSTATATVTPKVWTEFYLQLARNTWSAGSTAISYGTGNRFSFVSGGQPKYWTIYTYDRRTKRIFVKGESSPLQVKPGSSTGFFITRDSEGTTTGGTPLECDISQEGLLSCSAPGYPGMDFWGCEGSWWLGNEQTVQGCGFNQIRIAFQAVDVAV